MKRLVLTRLWGDRNQTTGIFTVVNGEGQPMFGCLCIERGFRHNKRNVSNVPAGTYPIVREWSAKFKRDLWELKNVPHRGEVKIHPANYWYQLQGCIALGLRLKNMNRDGYYDLTRSAATVKDFHYLMRNESKTTITIYDPASKEDP